MHKILSSSFICFPVAQFDKFRINRHITSVKYKHVKSAYKFIWDDFELYMNIFDLLTKLAKILFTFYYNFIQNMFLLSS